MKYPTQIIHPGNVTHIAQALLKDYSDNANNKDDKDLDVELSSLGKLLYLYRYGPVKNPPKGLSNIEWAEALTQELIRHTLYCAKKVRFV